MIVIALAFAVSAIGTMVLQVTKILANILCCIVYSLSSLRSLKTFSCEVLVFDVIDSTIIVLCIVLIVDCLK